MKIKYSCSKSVFVMLIVIITSVLSVKVTWADALGSKPAVSSINTKISGGYADFDSQSVGFGTASVTLPLTHRFGFSIDGLGGNHTGNALWAAGGNLFWRNPDKGLIGIMGANVQMGSNRASGGGVTGELYLGQFSVLGDVGYQTGHIIRDSVFTDLKLRWYAIDNLAFTAGCVYAGKGTAGVVSMEYMPALKIMPGLALFVDGGWGNKHYQSVMAGVRYYFGRGNKTLKARHREDDPENSALNGLILGGQAGFFETRYGAEGAHHTEVGDET